MNCKIVQELIITEYFDGQMFEARKIELEKHLGCCLKCKEFLAAVEDSSMEMFKNSGKVEPPYSLWLNIKDKIIAKQELKANLLVYFLNKFKNREYFPRAAFAMALGVMLVIFINTGMNKDNKEIASSDISGRAEYVNYLLGSFAYNSLDSDNGYGTDIEKYFL